MHADLVDQNGKMTITVNINNNYIARFLSYFSVGKSVRIKDFAIKKKGIYDRGNAKYTILLQQASSVENIPQVCNNVGLHQTVQYMKCLSQMRHILLALLQHLLSIVNRATTSLI